jgi:hypothetical protein
LLCQTEKHRAGGSRGSEAVFGKPPELLVG